MAEEHSLACLGRTDNACYGVTADQRIVFWNAAAQVLFGRHASEVVGQHCFEAVCFRHESGETLCERDCLPIQRTRAEGAAPIRRATVRTPMGGPRVVDVVTIAVAGADLTEPCLVHYIWPAPDPAGTAPLAPVSPRGRRKGHRRSVLTATEGRILALLAGGASTAAIAVTRGIAYDTARNHIQHVIDKLGAHSRLEAVALARRRLLLPPLPSADR